MGACGRGFRRNRAFLGIAIGLAASRQASASPSSEVQGAPSLPALTHRDTTYTLDLTLSSLAPHSRGTTRACAWLLQGNVEVPVLPEAAFVGVALDAGGASVPGVGRALEVGNPEVFIRGVWSNAVGLASGAGLGLVLPAPRTLTFGQAEILRTVRVIRPWDASYFSEKVMTFRPFFDIRYSSRSWLLQTRQGVDWSLDLGAAVTGEQKTDLAARAAVYAGFLPSDRSAIGVEVWEVYQLIANIPDDKRASFVLSPSVRFALGRVAPSLSLLLPLTTPLRGDVESYVAARLIVAFLAAPKPSRSAYRSSE